MDWEAFLARLGNTERSHAEQLLNEFGSQATVRRIRYYPVNSTIELESLLRKDRSRIATQVLDLYESIDVNRSPSGWSITNTVVSESDGTEAISSEVIGPNGATGFFEGGF